MSGSTAGADRPHTAVGYGSSWEPLIRAGAVSAGLAVVVYTTALVTFTTSAAPPVTGGARTLEYVGAHRISYIVRQILWLMPSLFMMVVFLALTVALWHQGKSLAAIAGVIGVASWAVSFAWPATGDGSLAMVLLSDHYMTAATGAQRIPFVAGAEVLIALNDLPAAIGVLQAIGVLLISVLMLRGTLRLGLARLGVLTGAVGIASELLRPLLGWAYATYGILLFAWLGWLAVALWRLDLEAGDTKLPRMPEDMRARTG